MNKRQIKKYTIDDLELEYDNINPNGSNTVVMITVERIELLMTKIVELTNRIQELENDR